MIIIDIPTWMLLIGWFFTQSLKISSTFFILILALNRVDAFIDSKR